MKDIVLACVRVRAQHKQNGDPLVDTQLHSATSGQAKFNFG